ncbi:MAG: disulfide bond formation protein B [Caldilineales bacterium]|nr:disulfide bond formation protein B [Caldilineales bacterium]
MNARRLSLLIALLTAWVAMLGSLYFSEIAGFTPCTLCWYQRILMYPLTLILGVALLRREEGVAWYVLPLSLLGAGFATYHYLLQKTTLFGSGAVCRAGVPCTVAYINWFGFVTIPFLALTAFLIITLAMLFFLTAAPAATGQAEEEAI